MNPEYVKHLKIYDNYFLPEILFSSGLKKESRGKESSPSSTISPFSHVGKDLFVISCFDGHFQESGNGYQHKQMIIKIVDGLSNLINVQQLKTQTPVLFYTNITDTIYRKNSSNMQTFIFRIPHFYLTTLKENEFHHIDNRDN